MKRRLRRSTGFVPSDHSWLGCAECCRTVDEFTAIAERWRYWSNGRELVMLCPDCSRREFAPDAPQSGLVPVVRRRVVKGSHG